MSIANPIHRAIVHLSYSSWTYMTTPLRRALHRRTRQILCDSTIHLISCAVLRLAHSRTVEWTSLEDLPKKTLQSSLLVSHMGFHSSALEHLATHSPYREL
ncbi:hypothetical protein M422DRAFT_265022 [Sphaerobolus stellatus SS14]|uniref:Uncharacterized protein n=1 Tax=Sphaerobolus stellatus (strain SS14) TaxID=990650 RepID=A0A0C9V6P8_SPHS4|nr:hypothetical protein M422DRAFT_265022 [Sphaerobolus stellatus SS14]